MHLFGCFCIVGLKAFYLGPDSVLCLLSPSSSSVTMRELVHVQAGQCGNQIGAKCLSQQQIYPERGMSRDDVLLALLIAVNHEHIRDAACTCCMLHGEHI